MGAPILLGGIRGSGRLALTAAELESLLAVLHAGDRAAAGERYEAIRRRLLVLFAARHTGSVVDTNALADETLDRVARRLHEGIVLETSVESFVLGVARNVAREKWKGIKEVEILPAAHPVAPEPDSPDFELLRERDFALECLEKCLGELQPRPRSWVLQFYTGSGGLKIAARKRLAGELGLDLNALRVRLFRIRAKLERCVQDCLTGASGNDSGKGAIS
jgi:DNA-directed RNA polymerase specialized sigma24 family protein